MFLKLLDRPGNGWLLVQFLDSYRARGLVPATYVDIEVNDTRNPVSVEWLTEMGHGGADRRTGTHESGPTVTGHNRTGGGDKARQAGGAGTASSLQQSSPQRQGKGAPAGETTSAAAGTTQPAQAVGTSNTSTTPTSVSHPTLNLAHQLPHSASTHSFPSPNNSPVNSSFTTQHFPSAPSLTSQSMFAPPAVPRSVSISNVLQSPVGGVWYRVDARMSDHSMVYVAKRYQDFYNLHVALLQSTATHPQLLQLPRLPQPIRTNMVGVMSRPRTDRVYLESLLVRCNELNYYINQLIKGARLHMEVYNWLVGTADPRLVFANELAVTMFSDDINNKLYADSTNVMEMLLPRTAPAPSAPMAPSSSLQSLSSILDTYDHSSIASEARGLADLPDQEASESTWEINSAGHSTADTSADESSDKGAAKAPSRACPDTRVRHASSSSAESIFSAVHKSAPSTPTLIHHADLVSPCTPVEMGEGAKKERADLASITPPSTPSAGDLVKIKVSLNNAQSDIVALRIKRTNLISVVYLKKLLSHKIYKDFNLIHHYKLVAEGEDDMDDDALLDYMKLQCKVHLKLHRVRSSVSHAT